jgi:hypothetical protein
LLAWPPSLQLMLAWPASLPGLVLVLVLVQC